MKEDSEQFEEDGGYDREQVSGRLEREPESGPQTVVEMVVKVKRMVMSLMLKILDRMKEKHIISLV